VSSSQKMLVSAKGNAMIDTNADGEEQAGISYINGVLAEADRHKILDIFSNVSSEPGRLVVNGGGHYFVRVEVRVWGLPNSHLVGNNPETPDVNFEGIHILKNHFRGLVINNSSSEPPNKTVRGERGKKKKKKKKK